MHLTSQEVISAKAKPIRKVGTESHGSFRKIAGLPGRVARFFCRRPKADVKDIKHDVLNVKLFFTKIENRHSPAEG